MELMQQHPAEFPRPPFQAFTTLQPSLGSKLLRLEEGEGQDDALQMLVLVTA